MRPTPIEVEYICDCGKHIPVPMPPEQAQQFEPLYIRRYTCEACRKAAQDEYQAHVNYGGAK